jgi:hypothetical protein
MDLWTVKLPTVRDNALSLSISVQNLNQKLVASESINDMLLQVKTLIM